MVMIAKMDSGTVHMLAAAATLEALANIELMLASICLTARCSNARVAVRKEETRKALENILNLEEKVGSECAEMKDER